MKKYALFCGLTTIDIQYFVEEFPGANQKVKTNPPDIMVGGPAANAAITHSFLRGNSHFITAIGQNPFDNFITSDLISHKVNITDLVNEQQFNPVIASIVTTVKTADRSVISHLPQSIINGKETINAIDYNQVGIVLTDGFYPEIAVEICKKARENKIPVVFDGGSWKSYTDELLNWVDIAICSEHFITPMGSSNDDTFAYLLKKGIKKIAITRGEKDILWTEENNKGSIPVHKVPAIDSLGAGDIFHGAFVAHYIQSNQFVQSLKDAAAIASFSTRFKGTRDWMKEYDTASLKQL